MFKNRPWKEWKTRKATLVFSIVGGVIYTIIGIVMGFFDKSIDGTLTEQWFEFLKWVVLSGGMITVSKVMKGKTNSDEIEEYVSEDTDDEVIE